MIFGMLDFSLMDYMAVEDFFTEHVRTSAPSWRSRRHGLHYAMFLFSLLGFLMHVQPNCMTWIFEYVATYATACSLLPPCEPTWSCPGRPAAVREKEASCAMRQAPAVSFSSGELLLLSRSHVWNGVSDFYSGFYFGYSTLLSELDGGNRSYVDGQRSEEFGEEASAQIMSQLGPVPSPGAIVQLQGNLMAGVRVPPGSPTGGRTTQWQ